VGLCVTRDGENERGFGSVCDRETEECAERWGCVWPSDGQNLRCSGAVNDQETDRMCGAVRLCVNEILTD